MIQSNKFIYFIIGIVVGIAIGASVVWWMQNYDFKIWFTFSGKNKQEISTNNDNTNRNNNEEDKSKTNNSTYKSFTLKKEDSESSEEDSASMNSSNSEYLADTSSHNGMNSNSSDDIVIAKDELLFTRIIKIEGLNGGNSKKDALLDSLLINDKTKKLPANFVKVEFWRSPINYKGYKFSNNKLILFGIYIYEDTSLESRNNKLYLNYANTFYLIEKVDDFQPLMAVKLPRNK
ncbi:MAG: hypothetical protein HXX18_11130 [Bacteroidetes bacterium]|nr:hypothetical protein [Bacteroidota bacterium]